MHFLTPITKLLTSGTIIKDMLREPTYQDVWFCITPNSISLCDITEDILRDDGEVLATPEGPILTTTENPLNLPCDYAQVRELFKELKRRAGITKNSNFHIVADMPLALYTWKMSLQHKNVGALRKDLNTRIKHLIPSAPSNYRWSIMDTMLNMLNDDDIPDIAIIVGIPDESAKSIISWAAEMGAHVVNIYPIALLGLMHAMKRAYEPICNYIYWGNSAKMSVMFSQSKGVISAELRDPAAMLTWDYLEELGERIKETADDMEIALTNTSAQIMALYPMEERIQMDTRPILCANGSINLPQTVGEYINLYRK